LREEGGAIAPAAYRWKGRVIRLKRDDYDRWRAAYTNIANFDAELQGADDFYAQNPPKDGKWFFPVSNWLKKENAAPGSAKRATYSMASAFEEARRLRETF